MKQSIHPQWFDSATVTCACGTTFTVGAPVETLKVEICASCHPFFTGEMKYVDTLGRVERFQKQQKAADANRSQMEAKKAKRKKREDQLQNPKSLKEMLMAAR